jgi:anti-sigma regulatory factor (Ser/Thr protein kinase)
MAEHLNSISSDQFLVEVRDSSDVAEVRRAAGRLASREDLTDIESGNVALVATELATNLIKHAKHGRIIMRLLEQGQDAGIEIIALDSGPGIKDIAQSMRDGYSTAGSSGTGLGAVKRLTWQFDLHSIPGKGTAVLARLWWGRQPARNTNIKVGVIHLPMPGQEVSGDGWGIEHLWDKPSCVLVDGLGHGPDAALAAQAALSTAKEYRDKAPAEIIERAHGVLRSTRGAAVAIGEIDTAKKLVRFCGVGNITATIVNNDGVRHLVSYNGIIGQEARKIVEFTYPWTAESLLIMHSDGLTARWDIRSYPGLLQRHPALIAGVLYRDFSRGRDDATVLVARENDDPMS